MDEKTQTRYIRRQKRRCERKRAFESIDTAMIEGKRSIARGGVGALWVYHCLYCRKFHLTRNSNNGWPIHYVAQPA